MRTRERGSTSEAATAGVCWFFGGAAAVILCGWFLVLVAEALAPSGAGLWSSRWTASAVGSAQDVHFVLWIGIVLGVGATLLTSSITRWCWRRSRIEFRYAVQSMRAERAELQGNAWVARSDCIRSSRPVAASRYRCSRRRPGVRHRGRRCGPDAGDFGDGGQNGDGGPDARRRLASGIHGLQWLRRSQLFHCRVGSQSCAGGGGLGWPLVAGAAARRAGGTGRTPARFRAGRSVERFCGS